MAPRRWIHSVLAIAVLAAAPLGIQAQDNSIQADITQLGARLNDEDTRQEDRDEAARRLVSRQRDDANEILRQVLVSAGNRNGQLAVARALADDPKPETMFVDPLFALLGPDRALSEAATQALADFKGNADVLTRLIAVSGYRQQPESLRIAVIKAIGTFIEKRAADALMGLLTREDESVAIRNAAADGLGNITGLKENAHDVQKWQQWYAANAAKSEADWRLSLVNDRAAQLDQLQIRYTHFSDEVRNLLTDQYQLMPDAQKTPTLVKYLQSAQPEIRSLGARLVFEDTVNNRTVPAAVREQLRKMIGDSSPDVRIEVAGALRALNDAAALQPLLTQLAQEPNADVRAALARAIAPIRDLSALPELRKLLRDPSNVAAEAAADAIRELGPQLRDKDKAAAAQTAADLKEMLRTRTGQVGTQRLREAILQAMVPLREPSLRETFSSLLRPNESADVRRYALKGLGELHDPNTADLIINEFDDPVGTVRLEAVDALGKVVDSFQHSENLYHRLNPAEETDPSVRDHAWLVLQSLFPTANKATLRDWSDRFKNEPTRRLTILETLLAKQVQDKDVEAMAYTRQNIGETLMNLKRYADAAPYFSAALDYWTSKNEERATEVLINQLLNSLLRGHKYTEAVDLAHNLISKDVSQQQTVGPAFRAEAERLRSDNDADSVMQLITAARKMNPPLAPRYAADLEDIAREIADKSSAQRAPTTGPQSASTPGRKGPTVVVAPE